MLLQQNTQTGLLRKTSEDSLGATVYPNRISYYFLGVMLGEVGTLDVKTELDPDNPTAGRFIDVLWGVLVRPLTEGPAPLYKAYRVISGKIVGAAIDINPGFYNVNFKIDFSPPTEYVVSADSLIEWAVDREFVPEIVFRAYAGSSTTILSPWLLTPIVGEALTIPSSIGTAGTITYIEKEDMVAPLTDTGAYPQSFFAPKLHRMWWQDTAFADELSYDVSVDVTNADTDAVAIWTEMGETDPDRRYAINNFIKSQKRDGLWSNCDSMMILQNDTWAKCSFDWRELTRTLTDVGGCFVTQTGVKGGTGKYVNTHFTPSTDTTKATTNSAATAVYVVDMVPGADEGYLLGVTDADGNKVAIKCTGTSDAVEFGVNQTAAFGSANDVRADGLILIDRTSAGSERLYTKGALQLTASIAASAEPTDEIYLCANNNNGTPQTQAGVSATIAAVLMYSELSTDKHTKLLRNLKTYLTSIY